MRFLVVYHPGSAEMFKLGMTKEEVLPYFPPKEWAFYALDPWQAGQVRVRDFVTDLAENDYWHIEREFEDGTREEIGEIECSTSSDKSGTPNSVEKGGSRGRGTKSLTS